MVASPKFGPWWISWVQICLWFVLAPKVPNYALTNLLFGFCRSMWVIDCLSFLLVSSRSSNTPSTPKVLQARERFPIPYFSDVLISNSHLNLSRNLGARQLTSQIVCVCVCPNVCLFVVVLYFMRKYLYYGNFEKKLVFNGSWELWLFVCEGAIIFFVKFMKHLCEYKGSINLCENNVIY